MISVPIPIDIRKRTWSNISENKGEITMTIDFAHFGLYDVEKYRSGLKNQIFPTLLVELAKRFSRWLTFLALSAANQSEMSLQLSCVPKLSTPHRPLFCSQWSNEIIYALIYAQQKSAGGYLTNKRILMHPAVPSGEERGLLSEQRLVIEPRETMSLMRWH